MPFRRRLIIIAFLSVLFVTGCTTTKTKTNAGALEQNFPANAFMTHRAIFTTRGKQFALTGYLVLSESGGKRLIISQPMGQTMADVLVTPDGTVHVMQASPAFKPEWVHKYIAADLECIFGKHPQKKCRVQILDSNHFVIKHLFYKLDLRIVDTKVGPQPENLFDTSKAQKL